MSKIATSPENLVSSLVLSFRTFNDSKAIVSPKKIFFFCVGICLLSFSVYKYCGQYHLYLFFSIVSAFMLFFLWENINLSIYNYFKEKIEYFVSYYKNPDTNKEYDYFLNANAKLNLKEAIEKKIYSGNELHKSYYLGIRQPEKIKQKDLIALIEFHNIFYNGYSIDVFFRTSFFLLNVLYSIMILGLIMWVKKASIYNYALIDLVSKDMYKAIFVLIVLVLFALAISKFLKFLLPIGEDIKKLVLDEKNKEEFRKIEIFEAQNSNVNEIDIDLLEATIGKVEKEFNMKRANIFQIATPIFFLSYVSLVISFFQS